MKKISIWSPLRYANYGDDMQALAFALMLKEMGYEVKLFQLEESLAEYYHMVSSPNVDDLCKDVNLVIIAGGALLTPLNIAKRWLNSSYREYERDFRDLYAATKKYAVKFCAISMGGDGEIRNPYLYYGMGRRLFFHSDAFLGGTVRLEGDVLQMKQTFGKKFIYYPDMLFQAPRFFHPQLLPPTKKYRVGFNFKRGRYLSQKLLNDIMEYAETHDDMEFHFTTTHMQKVGLNYQYVPEKESKNIFIERYENPCQLLGVLASMDCFMTSMLHVGLTGLTTGTPFLSYRGPGKTKSFLHSIGGDWAILPNKISFEELRCKLWNMSKNNLYAQYNVAAIEQMKRDSQNHFEFCKKIVKELG